MSQPTPRPARRTGANGLTAPWTKAENEALIRLYPTALRAVVKTALPTRSWNAMGLQAGVLGIQRRRYWNEARLALLAQHYPSQGAAYVAALLGCPAPKVTKQASLQGIERVFAAKPTPTPKPAKPAKPPKPVKPIPTPKPAPQPKPVAEAVAQHQPARLNNLINQKARKKKKDAGDGVGRAVSLAYIKSLPYQDPEAHHYRMGGERAVLKYREQLQQQAA